jgi:hypothetical protein
LQENLIVSKREKIKYIHEGQYVAEVKVMLLDSDDEWAPCLSLDDAYKLDDVREALRHGDLDSAARYGRVFEMRPVARA